ncbi:MAG: hypothetical protein F4Y03_05375 [Alphaproteobacteria bacterium]|nr:hypothetical protein [Alphaproteobacteria bacterium]
MATITVRNVDDTVVAALKAQAKANQRSLEGEVRHLLGQQALRHARLEDFRERTARLAALTADRPQTDSALLLREDRDR